MLRSPPPSRGQPVSKASSSCAQISRCGETGGPLRATGLHFRLAPDTVSAGRKIRWDDVPGRGPTHFASALGQKRTWVNGSGDVRFPLKAAMPNFRADVR
jgi:hypothetical protein